MDDDDEFAEYDDDEVDTDIDEFTQAQPKTPSQEPESPSMILNAPRKRARALASSQDQPMSDDDRDDEGSQRGGREGGFHSPEPSSPFVPFTQLTPPLYQAEMEILEDLPKVDPKDYIPYRLLDGASWKSAVDYMAFSLWFHLDPNENSFPQGALGIFSKDSEVTFRDIRAAARALEQNPNPQINDLYPLDYPSPGAYANMFLGFGDFTGDWNDLMNFARRKDLATNPRHMVLAVRMMRFQQRGFGLEVIINYEKHLTDILKAYFKRMQTTRNGISHETVAHSLYDNFDSDLMEPYYELLGDADRVSPHSVSWMDERVSTGELAIVVQLLLLVMEDRLRHHFLATHEERKLARAMERARGIWTNLDDASEVKMREYAQI
jgi:hypothetical protein